MYRIEVVRSMVTKGFAVVIRRSADKISGEIAAVAKWNRKAQKADVYIFKNADLRQRFSPDEARDIADWFRLAAQAAEKLSYYFQEASDFDRHLTVKIVGKSMVVNLE